MISFGLGGVRGPASQEEKAQSALADWGEVIGNALLEGGAELPPEHRVLPRVVSG